MKFKQKALSIAVSALLLTACGGGNDDIIQAGGGGGGNARAASTPATPTCSSLAQDYTKLNKEVYGYSDTQGTWHPGSIDWDADPDAQSKSEKAHTNLEKIRSDFCELGCKPEEHHSNDSNATMLWCENHSMNNDSYAGSSY